MGVLIQDTNKLIVGSLTAGTGTQEVKVYCNDYNELENKPRINNVELVGNVQPAELFEVLSNTEIENLIQSMT